MHSVIAAVVSIEPTTVRLGAYRLTAGLSTNAINAVFEIKQIGYHDNMKLININIFQLIKS